MRLRNYAPRLYQAFSTERFTVLSCGVPVSCLRVRVSCFRGLVRDLLTDVTALASTGIVTCWTVCTAAQATVGTAQPSPYPAGV